MTDKPTETIQLPESCRAGLLTLHVAAVDAKKEAERVKQTYDFALNAAVSALGLDVTKPNHVDLDTGVVTLAE